MGAGRVALLAGGIVAAAWIVDSGAWATAQERPAVTPMSTPMSTPLSTSLPALTVREARERQQRGDLVLVDIRTPKEWADTGVPEGAIRLDMRDPAFEAKLAALRAEHSGKSIALICRTANRTARVQASLAARGWRDLINVEGGLLGNPSARGWLDEALPVSAPR